MITRVIFISIAAAFLIAVVLGPILIPLLRRLKFGQSIREEGPQSHMKKAGTPTMGGIFIILSFSIAAFIFANRNIELFLIMLVTLGFGLIGFLDDFIKIVFKRNLGLTSRQKLLGQIVIATIFYFFLMKTGISTVIDIPIIDISFDLGWLYFPFILIILVGASNGVNLTDGVDGLLAGVSIIAFGAYTLVAVSLSKYDVAIFTATVVGALLGFLVYNAHPAKVFMGDTGSLALGGAIAATAVLTKTEVLLVIIGGVYVIETLSVMIQVVSFKTRGKRVFRMSPIHHHFELLGWSEWKVVTRFWFVGLIFAALGVYIGVYL